MNQWWSGLNQREQRLLIIGGAALVLTLLYLLVVEPLFKHMQSLETSVSDQSELLQWMQESEQQISVLRRKQGNSSGRAVNTGGSLLALVDQTAKRSKLGEAIKRVEPEGSDGVRLWLEQASFDNILRWLAQIKQSQGVEVKRITIEQPDNPGIVNARISLTRGS